MQRYFTSETLPQIINTVCVCSSVASPCHFEKITGTAGVDNREGIEKYNKKQLNASFYHRGSASFFIF